MQGNNAKAVREQREATTKGMWQAGRAKLTQGSP